MKNQMSALDLKASVTECKQWVKARVVRVHASRSMLAIGLHAVGGGKAWLTARLPGFFFLAKSRPEKIGSSPFEAALRKRLEGGRILEIGQVGMERAVRVQISTKEGEYGVVVEVFSPGNVLLLQNQTIVALARKEATKAEGAGKAVGNLYKQPRASMWEMGEVQIEKMLEEAGGSDSVSSILAKNGMGRVYAKEVCVRAGIDPGTGIDRKGLKKLARDTCRSIQELLTTPFRPVVVKRGVEVVDVTPFPLRVYEGLDMEPTTYGEAMQFLVESLSQQSVVCDEKQARVERILSAQRVYLTELEKEVVENTKKGEHMFEEYVKVKGILDELKKARTRLSWSEIKQRLKGHPIIKEVHEEKGEIVVDI